MAKPPKNWKILKNFDNEQDFEVFVRDQMPQTKIRDSHDRTKCKNKVLNDHKTRIEKRVCKG